MPRCFKAVLYVSAVLMFAVSSFGQDLSPEEIIAKHLETIGKKEVRDQVKTLFALGLSSFESQFPVIKGGGKAMIVSDRDDLMFAMSLNLRDYPYEKIGLFHDKVSLPFISPGDRSLLGSFLNEHSSILTDGLFAGDMSLRWALLYNANSKLHLKSAGTKKLDGKRVYVIDLYPSKVGSDDFTIKLFFDADTFDHIRTEYHREVRAGTPIFGQQNQTANAEFVLTENFSDFKTADGLRLPYSYTVDFYSNSNTSSYKTIWGVKVSQYYVNQKLAPDFFTFDAKQ